MFVWLSGEGYRLIRSIHVRTEKEGDRHRQKEKREKRQPDR